MKFTRDVDAGELHKWTRKVKIFRFARGHAFHARLWTRTEFAGVAECNGRETEEEREETGREYESG